LIDREDQPPKKKALIDRAIEMKDIGMIYKIIEISKIFWKFFKKYKPNFINPMNLINIFSQNN